MKNLEELLKKTDGESYKKAAEIAASAGRKAIAPLEKIYSENQNPEIRRRVVKIIGSIKNGNVITFLKSALEDPDFEARRLAALTLKILTNGDYFDCIYKSETGRSFGRDFWLYADFITDELKNSYSEENEGILKDFADFFKALGSGWSYPEPENPKFFSFRRKQRLEMSGDGRILFKNFNYSLEKILTAGKSINYLIKSLLKAAGEKNAEKSEIEDIIRCMAQSLLRYLGEFEEALGSFSAAFHYLRAEIAMSLKPCSRIDFKNPAPPSMELKESLISCLGEYKIFEQMKNSDKALASEKIAALAGEIEEFESLCREFSGKSGINSENYETFMRMGESSYRMSIVNLNLISLIQAAVSGCV